MKNIYLPVFTGEAGEYHAAIIYTDFPENDCFYWKHDLIGKGG